MVLLTPARRRPMWHRLVVAEVEVLTPRAIGLWLEIPADLAVRFSFVAGQYLTLRAEVAGETVHQSYSIAVTPDRARILGRVRLGVQRVPGGRLSTWLHQLRVGETVEVLPPLGDFICPPVPGARRHLAFLAAGSGITPVLALLGSLLEGEPDSRLTLVLGNRTWGSVMFADELAMLETTYADRLTVVHVLTQEAESPTRWAGRLEGELLEELLESVVGAGAGSGVGSGSGSVSVSVDAWFLCGPDAMVGSARDLIAAHGASGEVHVEAFTANA